MPRDNGVHIAEEASAHHVDLAGAAFFGRRAVVTQGASVSRRREPLLHGNRRSECTGTEQVVAASMSGAVFFDGVSRGGLRFLRQPWQGIELADDADDRLAGTERRDERGRNVGDAALQLEARRAQLLLQQRAALLFLEADLGEAPDLLGDRRIRLAPRLDSLQDCGAIVAVRWALRDDRRRQDEQQNKRNISAHGALSRKIS